MSTKIIAYLACFSIGLFVLLIIFDGAIFLVAYKSKSIKTLNLVLKLFQNTSYIATFISLVSMLSSYIAVINFTLNEVYLVLNNILSENTSKYISLVIIFMMITYFPNFIGMFIITKISNLLKSNEYKNQMECFKKIVEIIPRKMILYLFIFLLIFFNTINTFENGLLNNLLSIKVDDVLLQSIATFIALNRFIESYKKGSIASIKNEIINLLKLNNKKEDCIKDK